MTLRKFLDVYRSNIEVVLLEYAEKGITRYPKSVKDEIYEVFGNLLDLHIIHISPDYEKRTLEICLDNIEDHKYNDYNIIVFKDFLDVVTKYSSATIVISGDNFTTLPTTGNMLYFVKPKYSYCQIQSIDTDVNIRFIIHLKE